MTTFGTDGKWSYLEIGLYRETMKYVYVTEHGMWSSTRVLISSCLNKGTYNFISR